MNEKLEKFIQNFYMKYPSLRPILNSFYRKFFAHYTFSGWGMQTVNELPWKGDLEQNFRQDCIDIKNLFEFTPNSTGTDKDNVDELWWRHWIINFCIVYVQNFTMSEDYNFVECGVGDGMTAFFACREIQRNPKFKNFKMHLYDSWSSMKSEDLLKSEKSNVGRYHNLNLARTKKNLLDFKNCITSIRSFSCARLLQPAGYGGLRLVSRNHEMCSSANLCFGLRGNSQRLHCCRC